VNWTKIENTNDWFAKNIPHNWLYSHYYEAFTYAFRIENALRLLVYLVLKSNLKKNWINASISSSQNNSYTIANIFKQKCELDRQVGYIGYEVNYPIMQLTLGELTELITGKYWRIFKTF